MTSRDNILNKLRAARDPFPDLPDTPERKTVTKLDGTSPDELRKRFIQEAETVYTNVYETTSESDALEIVMDIIGGDRQVMAWDPEHIPLSGLDEALGAARVTRTGPRDSDVRVGITGADAALAATGSIVVISDAGKSRGASLLPLEHIAVLKTDRILPDIETFYANQDSDLYRNNSNIAVISGPSKSADIAMTMIHGMHGPGKLHIVIVP